MTESSEPSTRQPEPDTKVTPRQQEALNLLSAAGVFYYDSPEEWAKYDGEGEPLESFKYELNMNDTFFWASGWGEAVEMSEMPEVARLFKMYGHHGLRYWVAKKNKFLDDGAEFHDVTRGMDFVAKEEAIAASCKSSSELAYKKVVYTLGRPRKWWKFWGKK